MAMTIADGLKYAEFLKERLEVLKKKIAQVECVKTTQRVVANTQDTRVEEVNAPTISITELTGDYDKTAKELRLIQQAVEKVNHSVELDFSPVF